MNNPAIYAAELATIHAAQERDAIIDELRAELEALRAAHRWIPVSERLPENYTAILFVDIDNEIHKGFYDKRLGGFWSKEYQSKFDATHWQPLPELPKEITS